MKALALKYRPQAFDELVEQEVIKTILTQQLETGTHRNAYLFTGGAGTGKTTAARIFAKELNQGGGNPIEIDAASNNGVDDVRKIIEDAKFKAIDAKYKVYILDECHMFSTGAWNAMLKLIEEPPAGTIFIFCTTDPQKIPQTILSRVQRYDFQRISHEGISEQLLKILKHELSDGESMSAVYGDYESAIDYIAKLADGGMRDAISMLDKCLAYETKLSEETVVNSLGVVNYQTMFILTDYILYGDKGGVIELIEEIYRSGIDLKQFMKQYATFLLDSHTYWILGNLNYTRIPSSYEDELVQWVDTDFDKIFQLLEVVLKLNADIKWETAPKPLIQATLLLTTTKEDY